MTRLVTILILARRAQSLTVLLLAALATAGAVAGPMYTASAERAVVASAVASASPDERTLRTSAAGQPANAAFLAQATASLSLPGFQVVPAREVSALAGTSLAGTSPTGTSPVVGARTRLVFRDGFCDHVLPVSGRCPDGPMQVMVSEQTADRLALRIGAPVTVQAVQAMLAGGPAEPEPAGPPVDLALVGIYRPRDAASPYWAQHGYFAAPPGATPAFLVTAGTLAEIPNAGEVQSVDANASPEAFRVDRLAALRTGLAANDPAITGAMTALLDRIDAGRSVLHDSAPVAALPLVALCWFVLFLVASHAAEQNRPELAAVALRGLTARRRWWLANGETALPALAGAPLGLLFGYLVVRLAGWAAWGGSAATVPVPPEALRLAAVALLGILAAVLLASWRQLRAPVLELFRQSQPRRLARSGGSVELVVLMLTGLAVVQAGLANGSGDAALLEPALLAASAGLLVALVAQRSAATVGRRALRRGRLTRGLAALQFARRPGGRRLVALVAIAVGLLGYAVASADLARQAWADRAAVELGAATVLVVQGEVPVRELLGAVAAVDPGGGFALPAAPLPATEGLPVLAVDSARLPVGVWPGGAGQPSAREVAARLRPAGSISVHKRLSTEVTLGSGEAGLRLRVHLLPAYPAGPVVADLGALRRGRDTYTAEVPGCAAGCRLDALEVVLPGHDFFTYDLVVHALRTESAEPVPVRGSGPYRWAAPRVPNDRVAAKVEPAPDGLRVTVADTTGPVDGRILPPDVPVPLPVVSTMPLPPTAAVTGLDGQRTRTATVAVLPMLPRLGRDGVLVDLSVLDRIVRGGGFVRTPEVWLRAGAPADLPTRLRSAGLAVSSPRGTAAVVRRFASDGPALALRFFVLAAIVAVGLAAAGLAVHTMFDRRWAPDLAALRTQGLAARTVALAAWHGHAVTVLSGACAGLLAAAAAVALAGHAVPAFSTGGRWGPVRWVPAPLPVAAWTAGAVLVLLAVVTIGVRTARRRSLS